MNELLLNKIESLKKTKIYKKFKNNPYLFYLIVFTICILQYFFKITGLIVSGLALLLFGLLYYTDNYTHEAMIKMFLITITSFLFFCVYTLKTNININILLTVLLAMNVFVMIFCVIYNPFYDSEINNSFLAFLVIITFIGTPFINVSYNKANLSKIFFSPNIYIILYTISFVLYFLYLKNHYLNHHTFNNIFALIIPFLMHFYSNRWLEYRTLLLSLFIIFDVFDISNYGL